jgi:hypothetical protein
MRRPVGAAAFAESTNKPAKKKKWPTACTKSPSRTSVAASTSARSTTSGIFRCGSNTAGYCGRLLACTLATRGTCSETTRSSSRTCICTEAFLHTLAVHHFAHVLYMFTYRQGNVRASRHAHDFEPFAAASRVVKMYAILPTSHSHFVFFALDSYLSTCIVLFVLMCGRRFFSMSVSSHLLNYVFVVSLWATTGALLMTPYRPCSGHNRLKLP